MSLINLVIKFHLLNVQCKNKPFTEIEIHNFKTLQIFWDNGNVALTHSDVEAAVY